jgi:GTP cyclohydrolase II
MYQLSSTKLDTHYGSFDFHCFSWGKHEEDNVLCLQQTTTNQTPIVRVQSACYTAEIFRSLDCDCHEQLETSLRRIAKEGGLLIYMLCDGRGAGLLKKIEGLELGRTKGLDTSEAYTALGLPQDPREYSRVAEILRYFGYNSVRLLTNNPRKVDGLAASGVIVTREPLEIPATKHSRPYLMTKAKKMGHLFNQFKRDQV